MAASGQAKSELDMQVMAKIYRFWQCLKFGPSALNSQVRVGVCPYSVAGRFALPLLRHGATRNSVASTQQHSAMPVTPEKLAVGTPAWARATPWCLRIGSSAPSTGGAALHLPAAVYMRLEKPLQTLLCHSKQSC